MKKYFLIIICIISVVGCKSTNNYCELNSSANICDSDNYFPSTKLALQEFDSRKGKKAFALAKTEDNWEYYGYSEGYESQSKANKRALKECQGRIKRAQKKANCELIR